jgi:hypothetical protein
MGGAKVDRAASTSGSSIIGCLWAIIITIKLSSPNRYGSGPEGHSLCRNINVGVAGFERKRSSLIVISLGSIPPAMAAGVP